jgi:hypothetical protein
MLAPPFIISDSEIDLVVERFTSAMTRTMVDLHASAPAT